MSALGKERLISGEPQKETLTRHLMIARCLGVVLTLVSARPLKPASAEAPPQEVPAYHKSVPHGKLPATLDPKQFPDALTQNVYARAAKIEPILYQQPCYCQCDRSVGHRSLLDCFVSDHASYCPICQKSAVYAYEQARQKRTAAQIRAGLTKGEWEAIDLGKYRSMP